MLARVPAVLVSNRPAARSAVGAGAVAGALSPGEPPMVSSKRVPEDRGGADIWISGQSKRGDVVVASNVERDMGSPASRRDPNSLA